MNSSTHLVNGTEVIVTPYSPSGAYVQIGDRRLSMGGNDPEQIARTAWQAVNPKPTPERIEAMRLAEQRGEEICNRCGGHGGWSGWPGYTCFECHGRRTIAVDPDDLPDPLIVLDRHDVLKQRGRP